MGNLDLATLVAIIRSSDDAIITKTLDGIVTSWNPAAERLFGYPAEEMIGRPITLLFPADRLHEEEDFQRRIRAGQRVDHFETVRVRKDGSHLDISVTLSPVVDAEGRLVGISKIARDISEEKRTREIARRLAAVSEASPVNLKLDDLLQSLLRLVQEFLHADTVAFLTATPDGSAVAVRATIGLEYSVANETPIPLGVGFSGRVAAARRTTYLSPVSPGDVASLFLRDSGIRTLLGVPLVLEDRLVGILNVGWRSERPVSQDEIDLVDRVGSRAAVGIDRANLFASLERTKSELEARVDERTAQLREVNAQLEAFASTVSHDLRAPLRGMHGLAQALVEDYADTLDPLGQTYARHIVAAAERMDLLIQGLLSYSRLSRANLVLSSTSLDAAVADAIEQVGALVRAREGRLSVQQPLGQSRAHHTTLVQVLANLITNAVKFVAPGVKPEVRIWTERHGNRVRLTVEDNGIGIESHHLTQIFKPFERLHGEEQYMGSGIGLGIVAKGVERMAGRVGVDSTPGKGSRFWIELPSADA